MYHSTGDAVRIAIVGSGIAGNVAAYKLNQEHDITVFESAEYVGGHTNTQQVDDENGQLAIDTGFIVFNDHTYPNFVRLLDEIGQASQESTMSFSVQSEAGDLEYCGSSINAMFAQRSNIFRWSFHRMVRDILRFYDTDLSRVGSVDDSETLGTYVNRHAYSAEFVDHYLVPMAAAIWSAEPGSVLEMPVNFLLRFFKNHGLLQILDRPKWRVIKGGSAQYVRKLVAAHQDKIRLSSQVQSIRRLHNGVEVESAAGGAETFDYIFIACHSDQALHLLRDATPVEREVLAAMRYQSNEAVLHTDVSLMPKRRLAWSAWNYHIPQESTGHVAVTYNMNILQGLNSNSQYLVTLNNSQRIDPNKILYRVHYDHPIYSSESVASQKRQNELNRGRTYFCGAYWGNGFHEDGVASALNAIAHFKEGLSNGKLHLPRAS